MATVGQVTITGGRTFNIHGQSGVLRAFTMPSTGTLNHIGLWCREQNTANANDLRGAIYTAAGLLVAQTQIIATPVGSTSTMQDVHIAFDAGVSLTGGTNYIMAAASNTADGVIIVSGQNGPGGDPVSFFVDPYFWPYMPDNLTAAGTPPVNVIDTGATRAWDIYLDYTVAAVPTVTSLTPASPVRVGQVGVVIAGTNFGSTQGTGHVVISPSNDVNDVNAVTQTVTAWGASSITINVVRNTLALATNLYLFVVNDGGSSNASGSVVQILPSIGALAYGAGLLN